MFNPRYCFGHARHDYAPKDIFQPDWVKTKDAWKREAEKPTVELPNREGPNPLVVIAEKLQRGRMWWPKRPLDTDVNNLV